jgi:putative acetyltransferase
MKLPDFPPGLALRPGANADGPAARELIFPIIRSFGLTPDPEGTDRDLSAIEDFYFARGGCFDVLIETASGRLVGTVGLAPRSAGVVELRKLYLDAGFRGRGVGRALLRHAMHVAREMGFQRMILETTSRLETALRLYVREGFRPSEEPPNACRCEIVLERRLIP